MSVGMRQPVILPILACRPCLDVGIPVALAIFRLAEVIPSARFQLNDNPGIPVFDRLAIQSPYLTVKSTFSL